MSFNKIGPAVDTSLIEDEPITYRETFHCRCGHPEHTFFMELDEDWGVSAYVSASNSSPWYKRIAVAIKYVFNLRTMFWDDVLLSKEDVIRLKDLLINYESKLK